MLQPLSGASPAIHAEGFPPDVYHIGLLTCLTLHIWYLCYVRLWFHLISIIGCFYFCVNPYAPG
jgi:hypothetical protein